MVIFLPGHSGCGHFDSVSSKFDLELESAATVR